MKRIKRAALLLLINVLVLVPLVYGFEFYLRFTDVKRKLPPNGIVNGQMLTWGHPVKNNRFGFRERDFVTPKPPGVFRVLVLGDSLTWGAGLADDERYSNLLEQKLRAAYPRRNFEVLNFGVSGGPTIGERDLLNRIKDEVQPDLIVVGFCVNDPQPRSQDYSIEREAFENYHARRLASLKYRLEMLGLPYTSDLIRKAIFGWAEKSGRIPTWNVALDRTYSKDSPDWKAFVEALRDIKSTSDAMKLPTPIFVTLNQSGTTGSDYAHPSDALQTIIRWCRLGEQAAAEVGFKTVDYEKEIPIELANDSMSVNVADGHPSAKLNQLYAKKLFGAVVEDLHLNDVDKTATIGKPSGPPSNMP